MGDEQDGAGSGDEPWQTSSMDVEDAPGELEDNIFSRIQLESSLQDRRTELEQETVVYNLVEQETVEKILVSVTTEERVEVEYRVEEQDKAEGNNIEQEHGRNIKDKEQEEQEVTISQQVVRGQQITGEKKISSDVEIIEKQQIKKTEVAVKEKKEEQGRSVPEKIREKQTKQDGTLMDSYETQLEKRFDHFNLMGRGEGGSQPTIL